MTVFGSLVTVKEVAAELDRVVAEALDGFRKQDITDDEMDYILRRLVAWRAGMLKARIDWGSDEDDSSERKHFLPRGGE